MTVTLTVTRTVCQGLASVQATEYPVKGLGGCSSPLSAQFCRILLELSLISVAWAGGGRGGAAEPADSPRSPAQGPGPGPAASTPARGRAPRRPATQSLKRRPAPRRHRGGRPGKTIRPGDSDSED